MAITFAKPRLMRWNNNNITDHNRSDLSIEVERIENKKRMANGTMRKYIVADKRTFSTSWDMVPSLSANTVDGYWGASAIETFYNTVPGPFTLELTLNTGDVKTYTVMMSSFSKELKKRGIDSFWNINVAMEEV